jgi:peptide/nickel transport system substrate-binding protein
LALFIVLAGCAPAAAPPVPAPAPAPAPAPTVSPAPVPAPTTPAGVKPKSGGTLVYPVSTSAAGYDLHIRPSYGPLYAMPVFNNLVRLDASKKDIVVANIIPDLATRWEISTDGKVMTFYLAKNVKWHDGIAFNADDVVYSVTKMVDPKRSSLAGMLVAFDKIEKLDDYTVRITLKDGSPSFLLNLAGPYSIIESKHKDGVDQRTTDFLVGTGPFKLKSLTPAVRAEYVRNTDYFKPGLPYLDNLVLSNIADQQGALNAFIAKRTDMTTTISGIRNDDEMALVKAQASTAIIDERAITRGIKFWINMDSPNLKDIRVRQALTMLVDTHALVKVSQGSDTWAFYDTGIFASPYAQPQDVVRKTMGWDVPWAQRVVKAKQLMTDAGFASGFKIRLVLNNNQNNVRKVQVVVDTWKQNIGVDAEIIARDTPETKRLQDNRDFDILFQDSTSNLGDPDEDMNIYMTGAVGNFLKYSNPAADKLWVQQAREMDTAKRIKLTQEIERLMMADMFLIPTAGSRQYMAWWPWVKGYVQQEMTYGPNTAFELVWLDNKPAA